MKYNLDYLENLLRIQAKTGELIAKIRWDFIDIQRFGINSILDYGCGCGFFRAYRPRLEEITIDSYDINPNCPQTGITCKYYDLVCMWDVLEHLTAPLEFNAQFIALTIPIKPAGISYTHWHHFKPEEHLVFFNQDTLDMVFEKLKYKRIKIGQPECPPRRDVWSILYEKNNS